MRCFYTTLAIQKMLYVADLFLIPESHMGKARKDLLIG